VPLFFNLLAFLSYI